MVCYVEGAKVTPEIATIRRVPVHRSIDSPNRFDMFACPDDGLDWITVDGGRGARTPVPRMPSGGYTPPPISTPRGERSRDAVGGMAGNELQAAVRHPKG